MWQTPIIDRTQSDVIYAKVNQSNVATELKGSLDYRTLNRIEQNISYVSNVLNEYGYKNILQDEKIWLDGEVFYLAEFNRITSNLQIVRNALAIYTTTPDVPSLETSTGYRGLTFEDANDIEKILVDVEILLTNMIADFPYINTFYSNQQRVRLDTKEITQNDFEYAESLTFDDIMSMGVQTIWGLSYKQWRDD